MNVLVVVVEGVESVWKAMIERAGR